MPKYTPVLKESPRFSFQAWQRYAPLVQKWFAHYPSQFRIKPSNLAPETVIARLRDAARGHLTFGWAPDTMDRAKFIEIWEDTVVSADGGHVVLSSRTHKESPILIHSDERVLFTILSPTKVELIALLTLANNERFESKHILITKVGLDLIPWITGPDVADTFQNVIIESLDRTTYKIL
jgi:hypothetical protein